MDKDTKDFLVALFNKLWDNINNNCQRAENCRWEATTHWASVQFLNCFGATFVDERVVADGKLVSAAGLTAGIDGALRVAALLRGEAAAKAIQLDIQYAPEPPFDCGHPDKAPEDIVARQRAAFRPLTEKRQATAKRVAAKLGVQIKD